MYRIFTWIANLSEDKVKKITDEQRAKMSVVSTTLTRFSGLPGTQSDERKLVTSVLGELGRYRIAIETAIDLSTVDVSTGMMAIHTADTRLQAMPGFGDCDGAVHGHPDRQFAQTCHRCRRPHCAWGPE